MIGSDDAIGEAAPDGGGERSIKFSCWLMVLKNRGYEK